MRIRVLVSLVMACSLVGCGAPLFRTSEQRYAPPSSEVLEQLEPYLEAWATLPAEETEQERKEFSSRSLEIVDIAVGGFETVDGSRTQVVVARLEMWGDWERGYLYVYEGADLKLKQAGWSLRKLDAHSYIYNHNLN